MQENIKTLADQIFSINPTVSTAYGSAATVGSRDMAGGGISNSASDIIFKLRAETASLVETVPKNNKGPSSIEAKVNNIEGYLLALQAIGQISDQFCNDTVKALRSIA